MKKIKGTKELIRAIREGEDPVDIANKYCDPDENGFEALQKIEALSKAQKNLIEALEAMEVQSEQKRD